MEKEKVDFKIENDKQQFSARATILSDYLTKRQDMQKIGLKFAKWIYLFLAIFAVFLIAFIMFLVFFNNMLFTIIFGIISVILIVIIVFIVAIFNLKKYKFIINSNESTISNTQKYYEQ